MARIASLLELALVRIQVTVGTVRKLDSGISRLAIRASRMATLAQHVPMFTGQWIMRCRVVEVLLVDGRGLPIGCGMTSSTISPKSALMMILMAVDATCGQPHPGVADIFSVK